MRIRTVMFLLVAGLAAAGVLWGSQAVQAYPEFAERTGEPCATCHINPAGGGPRTERGQLWILLDKPDVVPQLPGSLSEALEQPTQAQETSATESKAKAEEKALEAVTVTPEMEALFMQFGCVECHGFEGVGGIGPALDREVLDADLIRKAVREGGTEPNSQMPAYSPEELSDEQLDQLVTYVQALGAGLLLRVEDLECYPIRRAQ